MLGRDTEGSPALSRLYKASPEGKDLVLTLTFYFEKCQIFRKLNVQDKDTMQPMHAPTRSCSTLFLV
jgi:hypothetical protein